MKTVSRKHIWLLIPVLVFTAFLALMAPSRAFAGNVRLSHTKVNLYRKGGQKTVQLVLYDDDMPVPAIWKSSRKRVASVSANGFVKAKRNGTTKITATYGGVKYTCKIKVRSKSATYKRCIKAYKKFLMNPYVTYTEKGNRGQADNFYSLDLDGNGIPELLVNVVAANGNRYHVLYHYTDNRITIGQELGVCGDFIWYPSARVMNYTQYESGQTLYFWSRDNGITLNSMAIIRHRKGKNTYYVTDGSIGTYGLQIDALDFRNYVDHDILGYCASKSIVLHVNTPYNRSRYLK